MAKSKRGLEPKTAVFIDGANFYASTKAFGFMIDYKRLREWLAAEYGALYRVYWYSAYRESGDSDYNSLQPLVDWLGYNGFHVTTRVMQEFMDSMGRQRVKGNMAVDIACDIIETAPHVTNVVVISGDGALVRPLRTAMQLGCTSTVISTKETQPSFVSDELRRTADTFRDIANLRQHFEGNPYPRVAARA